MSNLIEDLTSEISQSVLKSALDYFEWTRGRVLYNDGAEALLSCNIARDLFKKFGEIETFSVRLEAPIREVVPIEVVAELTHRVSGRVDLSAILPECFVVLEAKRYTHITNIRSDLDRLIDIVLACKKNGVKAVGFLAACAFEYDDRAFVYQRDYRSQILAAYQFPELITKEIFITAELLPRPTAQRRDTAASVVIRLH